MAMRRRTAAFAEIQKRVAPRGWQVAVEADAEGLQISEHQTPFVSQWSNGMCMCLKCAEGEPAIELDA